MMTLSILNSHNNNCLTHLIMAREISIILSNNWVRLLKPIITVLIKISLQLPLKLMISIMRAGKVQLSHHQHLDESAREIFLSMLLVLIPQLSKAIVQGQEV